MKIGLVGTYDVNNFGDCMFPELYQHLLKEQLPEAQISLYSPRPRPSDIVSFDRIKALPQTLTDAETGFEEDALVLTGGEMIGMGHTAGTYIFPGDSLSAYLRLWMSPAVAASRAGGPTYIAHCIGATKLSDTTNRKVADALSSGGLVTFRDPFSQSWIRSGAATYDVAVDPMFLLDTLLDRDAWQARASALLPQGYEPGAYLVAQTTPGYIKGDFSIWVKGIAAVARRTGLKVLLLPICHFLFDEVLLERAKAQLAEEGVDSALVRGRINVKDTAALIGCSGGYCGTSLHGAVTAVAFAKPLAVLGHSMDGKHEGTLRSVGVHGAVTVDPRDLPSCFEVTLGADRAAARSRAQTAAREGFAKVIEALGQPRPAKDNATARSAAEALASEERAALRANRSLQVKRAILGPLSRFEGPFAAYRRYRIMRAVTPASQPSGS